MLNFKKLGLIALAICATSTVAHAGDSLRSYGTASAKVTLQATHAWKIEKKSDVSEKLDVDGHLADSQKLASFDIKNLTTAAGDYTISPVGTSADSEGKFVAYKTGELSTTFAIKPVVDGSELPFNDTLKSYGSLTNVGAGETQTVDFVVASESATISPGEYNVQLELYAPSV